jgi:hypothetical protein
MTVGGSLYELPKLESPIAATGASSSPVLRTPQANLTERKSNVIKLEGRTPQDPQVGLADQIGALLLTPTSQLAINGGSQHPDKRRAGGHGPTLADQIEFLETPKDLLPTPVAQDDQKSPAAHVAAKNRYDDSERTKITSLTVMGRQALATGKWDNVLLPTPTVGDASSTANATAGRTNPDSKHHSGTTLTDAARMLEVQSESEAASTPTARDGKDVGDLTKVPENSLLPRVIYNLPSRGGSTNQRSVVGNPSSDQSPIPMTNEDDSLAA